MDETKAAEEFSNVYRNKIDSVYNGGYDMLRILEKILDKHFQAATRTFENIDITTPKGTLNFGNPSMNKKEVKKIARIIATEVSRYWSTTIELTGEPQECDEIKEVVNDASKIIEPLTNDLLSIGNGKIKKPNYYELFTTIFNHVRSIIWNVKEKDSNKCEKDFVVNVE